LCKGTTTAGEVGQKDCVEVSIGSLFLGVGEVRIALAPKPMAAAVLAVINVTKFIWAKHCR
jgi:hypothetical protein